MPRGIDDLLGKGAPQPEAAEPFVQEDEGRSQPSVVLHYVFEAGDRPQSNERRAGARLRW